MVQEIEQNVAINAFVAIKSEEGKSVCIIKIFIL